MSLSTVFSLLTSTSSSSVRSIAGTLEGQAEDTTNGTSISTFSSTATANITIATASSGTTTGTNSPSSISLSRNSSSSSESNFNSINLSRTTEASFSGEDIFNGTTGSNYSTISNISNSIGVYNKAYRNSNSSTTNNINRNFANELEFQNQKDDAHNDSFSTSTEYSIDNFGDVHEEPTHYAPLFYFLLTIVLGIYVYLYFLQRHLRAKAVRAIEAEQKKKSEERCKREGCRYDFEDEEESDYGPPEQNLSVAALRFYGGRT